MPVSPPCVVKPAGTTKPTLLPKVAPPLVEIRDRAWLEGTMLAGSVGFTRTNGSIGAQPVSFSATSGRFVGVVYALGLKSTVSIVLRYRLWQTARAARFTWEAFR